MRIHIYVDGESHFIRTQALWQQLHGAEAQISEAVARQRSSTSSAFPDIGRPILRLVQGAQFLWDTNYQSIAPQPYKDRPIDGAAYFISYSGDDDGLHAVRVAIRAQGFDPQVTHERKQLSEQRKHLLKSGGLLEKAKGVDIGLSVRAIEDAYHNIYDVCFLFTSDVDFLPVIRVVQRIGKKVVVFGYKAGLGIRSEIEFVPDAFVDLAEYTSGAYERVIPADSAKP